MELPQQRHHFIPRFILKRFAPEDQPPAGPLLDYSSKNAGERKKRRNRRDFLVNKVDFEKSLLTQRPVSTEFALLDMYRDIGVDQDPYYLEKKLSNLENDASSLLQRACSQFAQGLILKLKRTELDNLRKFLFLMKYRNSGMFDRYNHDHIDGYQADDRERMMDYMRSNGLAKPLDVWLNNLRQFLDLEMDPANNWIGILKSKVYPDDAEMMVFHLKHSFIAFCEPISSDDEFLLTQNAYCIFEGPSTVRTNTLTQETKSVLYTEYHNFAPISPRLIIVLRSPLLSAYDQNVEMAGNLWDDLSRAIRSQHLYPDKADSILHDLPISRCHTVYVQQHITSSASFDANDQFHFQCFKISSGHVKTINSLLLEEANTTSSLIYHSCTSLKASIETYLRDETFGMKSYPINLLDKRRLYLMTLEKIVRDLGGSTICEILHRSPDLQSSETHMSEFVAFRVAIELLRAEEEESPIPQTFFNDVYQASLMLLLRIKMDTLLNNSRLTTEDKYFVRFSRQAFFMEFPVERLWLYFKIGRNLSKFHLEDFTNQIADLELYGAEDKFAKCK
ncbi:hypothetical protein N7495_005944 [Penicillium taxi]|uniref:uncharacterized protein n=1 Tax=Penicillium taxi TaxID=168475 RepID=UPI0025455D7B|nr:uncharacterized protein N7495_005944 [Penicillium taxi]KAJ5894253.1 hypothetical protein N7495_005944 [Penicillium taxi]